MNEDIIKGIAIALGVKNNQVLSVLKLLEDGNTIPFIARYRKEATGSLDEEQIRKINEVYQYQVNLLKRKEDVIRLIDEKGLLTDELKIQILKCEKLVEVEDLYRPYKEKKKTKATEAINNGLEPLAKIIISMPDVLNVDTVNKFINDKVKTYDEAIAGAKYIISEWISDNAYYRKWIRNFIYNNGDIVSEKKKKAVDETRIYEIYYNYNDKIKCLKPHRILALNRGEKEGILNVSLDADDGRIVAYLESKVIRNNNSSILKEVRDAVADSYRRLIKPSIEREIRSDLTSLAENQAIDVFAKNLEKLLLQPPMKEKIVLGLDPAYRTGCKLAVVDSNSKVLNISVIYPHEPKNMWDDSKKVIRQLIFKYNVSIIAIGNGTASRESESLVAEVISEIKDRDIRYVIVNEAGASVYSASKIAISEFPSLHVEERSAISIARRLQDPLSELVKIDSKSIGVGLYQHDVNEKKLDESLDFVVSKAVNNVGININTASASILKYISGMTKSVIDKIIAYREKNGKINSRAEYKKIKGISDKVYEQSVGFIRVIDGTNKLDVTPIHPESYDKTLELIDKLGYNSADIGSDRMLGSLNDLDISLWSDKLGIDTFTLNDIVKSLKQPTRDYRDDFEAPILKSDIVKIENLKNGMKLQGTVRNVVDFGAFVDIGLKNDGLVHISEMSNSYIKHPLDIVSVGDIVDCYVKDINLEKGKVQLSFLEK